MTVLPSCLASYVNETLAPLHSAAVAAAGPTVAPSVVEIITPETIADLESALSIIPADDYHTWIKIGLALASLGEQGRLLFMWWSATSSKFDPQQAAMKWDGFVPDRTGYRAVFAEAKRRGWINPRSNPYSHLPSSNLSKVTCKGELLFGPEFRKRFAVRPNDADGATDNSSTDGVGGSTDGTASDRQGDGFAFLPTTPEEWTAARATPDCIVEDLYYADVAVMIAPGGTGKTTLLLFIGVHIVLGLPLFGRLVLKPGPVFMISAEDSREMLVARLRSICSGLRLEDSQIETVMQDFLICDVSGMGIRLTEVASDVVKPASVVIQQLIAACSEKKPVMVMIDPAVSFGVGESRVNDAEQGLVEAARRIRRTLNCCVLYVHHTGKQNARDKASDQYAGRGGSAFADGARMVHVLQSMGPGDWLKATGLELGPNETGLILARPKMSYTPPQGEILIRRCGYHFECIERAIDGKNVRREANASRILQLLNREIEAGRHPTQNVIETLAQDLDLKRNEIRAAIHQLKDDGRVEERDLPTIPQRGSRHYLYPVGALDVPGAASTLSADGRANEK
jgi:RecA-family ATPase